MDPWGRPFALRSTAGRVPVVVVSARAAQLAVAAPLAAAYFKEPRVVPVIWILCLGLPLGAVGNIGIIAFRKDLEFHRQFALQVTARLLRFVVTIGAALWLRSYWALVIGIVAGYGIACALSYVMHPYRPRLSLSRVRELWSYSQWMLMRSIGHFVEMRADEVIVGGLGSTRLMGLYTVASELGRLPGSEIAAPLDQALVPGFAKVQHDTRRLAAAYLKVLGTVSAVTLPAGIGLALVAKEVVLVIMGAQWASAVPLLVLLAISGAVRTGGSLSTSLFLGAGRPGMAAAFSWLNAGLLLGLALPIVGSHGAEGVAMAKIAGGVILIVFTFVGVTRISNVTAKDIAACLWRPVLASVLMVIAVASVPGADGRLFVDLILKVGVGAVSYGAALLLLWLLAGCPDGAERFFLEQLRRRVVRQ
jgi:O-antigen/teichoic acid export membrane protein